MNKLSYILFASSCSGAGSVGEVISVRGDLCLVQLVVSVVGNVLVGAASIAQGGVDSAGRRMGNKASVSERIFAHASRGTRNDAQELSKLLAKLDAEQTATQSEFGHRHNLLEAAFGANQQTALLAACAHGDTSLQIVQALLAAGALVTTADLQGNNVFHTAAAARCWNCTLLMEFLLSAAPDRDCDPSRSVQALIPKLRPVVDHRGLRRPPTTRGRRLCTSPGTPRTCARCASWRGRCPSWRAGSTTRPRRSPAASPRAWGGTR